MKKNILFLLIILFSCDPDTYNDKDENIFNEWVFVACEGNFGASNGSISMINNFGEMKEVTEIGDVVQSLEVYNNKLFVIVNNSHKIIAYDITAEGLRMPGITIDTDNSSPREMKIVNDKLYFTNWNSSDIKILNLKTYIIEDSIKMPGKPESIEFDGTNLWTGIQLNEDYTDGNKLIKVNVSNNSIDGTYEIGKGPTSITFRDNNVFVANTYYDSEYNAFYGTTKFSSVDDKVDIEYYGSGVVCGGDVMTYNQEIYRSYEGGAAKIGNDLKILEQTKIGSFTPSQLYSSKINNDYIYFGITDFKDLNQVKVFDFYNNEIASYNVGIIPGDFAFWKSY